MRNLRCVIGLESASIRRQDKLQNIGITYWQRRHPKDLLPRAVCRSLCTQYLQTQSCKGFHRTPCLGETVRYNHLKASNNEAQIAGAVTGDTSASNTIQPSSHIQMIRAYFDVSRSTAYRILEKDNHLKNFNVYSLARNMNTLQRNSVDTADVRNHLELLCRCPITTEHNIAVMKELGLKNLTAEHFLRFHKYSKVEVAKMKRWGLLPQEYDPLEVLARLGIPQQVLNDVKFSCNIDNLTLEELHWKLSLVFLSWRLDCSREEVNRLNQTYRLAKKSMMLQEVVLDQLVHEWNISILKVRQNGYLLGCSPFNMALIGSQVKTLIGVDVREYASLTPRILAIPYHHLLEVNRILSKLPISTASVKALPRICTLHPDTLKERINHLNQHSEFSILRAHPRMLHLIYYHKTVTSRLNLLQQVKKSNVVPSLNKLSGSRDVFNKYVKVGDLRQNKKDIVMYLSQNLNVKPPLIRKCLHLPCWGSLATAANVQKNFSVLREEGFTEDQLLAGLDVLLYPPDLLQDQLTQLPQRPQVQPYSTLKSKVDVLQLLLYFMEKKASFISIR